MASPAPKPIMTIMLTDSTVPTSEDNAGGYDGSAQDDSSKLSPSESTAKSLWNQRMKEACWATAQFTFVMHMTCPPFIRKYNGVSGKPTVPDYTQEQMDRAWEIAPAIFKSAQAVYGATTVEELAELVPNLSDRFLQDMFKTVNFIKHLDPSDPTVRGPSDICENLLAESYQMDATRELSGDIVTDKLSLFLAGIPMFHQLVLSGDNWDVATDKPERALFLFKALEMVKEPMFGWATKDPASEGPVELSLTL